MNVQSNPRRLAPRVILHTPEPGSSAALYVEELSGALTAEDIAVRVVCPGNHQAREAMEANPFIDVRACRQRATDKDAGFWTKVRQNLSFIVSSCKALLQAARHGDIAHFQYILHLPFGLIFFACAWIKGARIVLTVHDPVPHKYLFPRLLRSLETGSLRLAYLWSDLLVVHSEAGKQKLIEAFNVPPGKIRIVSHGPYELKRKLEPCSELNCLEVLFFGSLRENKGLHLAIKATQQLHSEGIAIRLTIAGQVVNRKEEEYWQRCKTTIDPQSTVIRLIENFVPDEELHILFSQCHCFLLPYTTFSSDSGVAYMALANAKPIISTGAGGLGWLLANSRGGILISEATAEGVSAALRQACEIGPEALAQMGRKGAEWVLAECGWPRVARDTRKVYAEFLPQLGVAT